MSRAALNDCQGIEPPSSGISIVLSFTASPIYSKNSSAIRHHGRLAGIRDHPAAECVVFVAACSKTNSPRKDEPAGRAVAKSGTGQTPDRHQEDYPSDIAFIGYLSGKGDQVTHAAAASGHGYGAAEDPWILSQCHPSLSQGLGRKRSPTPAPRVPPRWRRYRRRSRTLKRDGKYPKLPYSRQVRS